MAAQDVALKQGRLFDAARDGRLFHAATAATGVAPGTAIGTTAAFALYNPAGSGVIAAIMVASMGYVSGTLGAGSVWHLVNPDPQQAAPTGTAIVESTGFAGGPAPACIALTTATIVAPSIVRPFCSLGASLASTAIGPWQVKDDVDGAIILRPGQVYALHATAAAGSLPLVVFGVSWEEVAQDAD